MYVIYEFDAGARGHGPVGRGAVSTGDELGVQGKIRRHECGQGEDEKWVGGRWGY